MKLFLMLLLLFATPLILSGDQNSPQIDQAPIIYTDQVADIGHLIDQPLLARSGGRAGGSNFNRSSRSSSSSGSGGSSYSYGGSSRSSSFSCSGGDYDSDGGSCDWGTGSIKFILIIAGIIFVIFMFSSLRSSGSYAESVDYNDFYAKNPRKSEAELQKEREEEIAAQPQKPIPMIQTAANNVDEYYNIAKVQFGLHFTASACKQELKRFIYNTTFETGEDLKALIITIRELMVEYQDYIKYGYAEKCESTISVKEAESRFNEKIFDERAKLTQETFVKLKASPLKTEALTESNKPKFLEIKEYIVFTLVVVFADTPIPIEDDYSWQGYRKLLNRLAIVDPDEIVATEIIWTPDVQDDVLTEDDITQFYPEMRLL